MECGHLDRVCKNGFQASNFPVLTDPTTKLECGECGDTTSVWLCVSCGALNCGRYIKAHGLMHKVGWTDSLDEGRKTSVSNDLSTSYLARQSGQ